MTAATSGTAPFVAISEQRSASHALDELYDSLDGLWTLYLQALESYTAAQQLLQKHMSSGFLSLARANFNSRNGRRYGRDYYHDRAVATRRVAVEVDENGGVQLECVEWTEPQNDSTHASRDEERTEKDWQSTPPAERESKVQSSRVSEKQITPPTPSDDTLTSPEPSLEERNRDSDPIRWFGILVPRELRDAQASFSAVIDRAVLDAAGGARRMRELEVEIRKLRKEIRKAEK